MGTLRDVLEGKEHRFLDICKGRNKRHSGVYISRNRVFEIPLFFPSHCHGQGELSFLSFMDISL